MAEAFRRAPASSKTRRRSGTRIGFETYPSAPASRQRVLSSDMAFAVRQTIEGLTDKGRALSTLVSRLERAKLFEQDSPRVSIRHDFDDLLRTCDTVHVWHVDVHSAECRYETLPQREQIERNEVRLTRRGRNVSSELSRELLDHLPRRRRCIPFVSTDALEL